MEILFTHEGHLVFRNNNSYIKYPTSIESLRSLAATDFYLISELVQSMAMRLVVGRRKEHFHFTDADIPRLNNAIQGYLQGEYGLITEADTSIVSYSPGKEVLLYFNPYEAQSESSPLVILDTDGIVQGYLSLFRDYRFQASETVEGVDVLAKSLNQTSIIDNVRKLRSTFGDNTVHIYLYNQITYVLHLFGMTLTSINEQQDVIDVYIYYLIKYLQ